MEKLFVLEAIQKGRDFGEVLQMWRESWETAKKTVEKMESDPAEGKPTIESLLEEDL